jgi:hypothetical protein
MSKSHGGFGFRWGSSWGFETPSAPGSIWLVRVHPFAPGRIFHLSLPSTETLKDDSRQ